MNTFQAIIIGAAIVAAAGLHGTLSGGRYVPTDKLRMLDTLTGELRMVGKTEIEIEMQAARDAVAKKDRESMIKSYCPKAEQDGPDCKQALDTIERVRMRKTPIE